MRVFLQVLTVDLYLVQVAASRTLSFFIFKGFSWWVGGFFGISTLVGFLMSNPIYTYNIYIYIRFLNEQFVGNIFKQARAHLFAYS